MILVSCTIEPGVGQVLRRYNPAKPTGLTHEQVLHDEVPATPELVREFYTFPWRWASVTGQRN